MKKRRRTLLLAIGLTVMPWVLAHSAIDVRNAGTPAFRWQPLAAPQGPMVVVVSLEEQTAHVYRNGIAIGSSPISSGRSGHRTPTGVFTILQKEREHHSNLYDDAPMPFMERLTWDGVALHAGTLPGYPASHGCVRLPQGFAERLFEVSTRGDTVVVSDSQAPTPEIVHPAVLAPVTPMGVPMNSGDRNGQVSWWDDASAPNGPVSILISLPDRRVYVMRNGLQVGSAYLAIAEGFRRSGAVVFVAAQGRRLNGGDVAPREWVAYPLRGDLGEFSMDALASVLRAPDAFVARVQAILAPGTSILVTDEPALHGAAAGSSKTILQSQP